MENQVKKENKFKKNLIRTVIGVITLGAIGFIGSKVYTTIKENNFKRVVTEEGEYDLENTISYDNLEKYNLVEVETIIGENKLFIADPRIQDRTGTAQAYIDIFTDKNIIEGNSTTVVNTQSIEDYLVAYDMIKAKYSKEDLEYLLDKINEDYKFTKEKTLVKE